MIACRLRCLLVCGMYWIIGAAYTQAAEDSFDWSAGANTIDELWAGYDPRAEPLDLELIKTWDDAGVRVEQLRFTGETRNGRPVRVFAYRGAPNGVDGRVPGVVHLHGGGQTASLDWIRFWGQRGYACVSFDFCGQHPNRPADFTTDWGDIDAHMLAPKRPPTNLLPTPRHSAWFHWALVSRRAVTLLEQHPAVDPERIGLFGISVGGTLTWLVAGVDSRVRAAVPIYGVGQNSYTLPWEEPADLMDVERRRFRDLLECEAYAPRIACPLLWLNSSNDHHGRLDLGMRTLDAASAATVRQAYTPLYMHHIAPAEGANLPLWMDRYLKDEGSEWPESPRVTFQIDPTTRKVSAEIAADESQEIVGVAWYWGLNNPWPMSRFYRVERLSPETRRGDVYRADVSLMSSNDTVYGFANVTYRSGVVLSSRLERFIARDQNVVLELQRSKQIDALETSDAWYWLSAPTDPCLFPTLFEPWRNAEGETGFSTPLPVFQFATNVLSDPQWRGRGKQALQIDVLRANWPAEFEIEVAEHFFQPTGRSYKFQPQAGAGSTRWITLRLKPADFLDSQEAALAAWDEVDYLLLRGKHSAAGSVVFRNLQWENLEE